MVKIMVTMTDNQDINIHSSVPSGVALGILQAACTTLLIQMVKAEIDQDKRIIPVEGVVLNRRPLA